ncbi:MAG: hypothetical protein LBO04_01225 [Spirochaetaceae bacterium]|jgi:hypothetical protein|nr:hypothetical protein [Spirochaetaceae bacterium]
MGENPAPNFRLRQLKWQIEESPDSEDFIIPAGGGSSEWLVEGGTPDTIQWETMYDGGNAETPESEYRYFLDGNSGENITVRGIFDECVENDKGRGTTRRVPRVILFSVPAGNKRGVPIIIRGREYKIEKQEIDANIGIILRLN